MASGGVVPGSVGLHAVLAAPHVSPRRFLEISRNPSFVRRSGLDFGGTLPPGEPVSGNHPGRRDIAAGGYFTQPPALGPPLQHVSFRVFFRPSVLDTWVA